MVHNHDPSFIWERCLTRPPYCPECKCISVNSFLLQGYLYGSGFPSELLALQQLKPERQGLFYAPVPLILSHMRQDPMAPRPITWDETFLAGGGRGEPGKCCFLSRGWTYGFPKTTVTYNPFSPPLHNFCLNAIHGRTSGEFCACSWSLSRHTAQAAASGSCWPTLTSTSALLAPWDLHGSICERSRATLPLATSLTLGIQSHKYVSRWRVAWLHGQRTSLWWH